METIEIMNWILGVLTIVAGGGWFVNWKANKKKTEAEAMNVEAEGWAKQQGVYQETIADMERFNDMYRKYNTTLIEENNELRKKYTNVVETLDKQQREISRLGRRIDGITPFLCGFVGCQSRVRVDLKDDDNKNEKEAGV